MVINPSTANSGNTTYPALTFGHGAGNTVYNGIVYVANPNSIGGNLVNMAGNTTINGGMIIDGPGTINIGAAKGIVRADRLL